MTSPFSFDWVAHHAERTPDAPAVGTPAGWLAYDRLGKAVRAIAGELAESGVGRGSFVLISSRPTPASVAASLAIHAVGACAVEVHPESEAKTLAGILEQTKARHALIQGRGTARWLELAASYRLEHLFVSFPSPPPARLRETLSPIRWSWLPEQDPSLAPSAVEFREGQFVRRSDAAALLVYTSGSTGTPRGVVQTHANLFANTLAISRYLGLASADRALSILPLAYCYGRSILQTHLFVGGSVFFDHRFVFPRVVMESLAAERCTGFYGVPLTFELLKRQLDPRELDLGSLRYVAQAGGAMRQETIDWVRDAFSPAPLFVMYGQTEATARLSYLAPEHATEKAGSIGRGLENVELRIVDEAGREVAPGVAGEVIARGPSITQGYFQAPEETTAILKDGWLWTGDVGRKDDEGFVFLVGRAKDMLKVGGHRVSAAEIERALTGLAGVREAAVIGIPDTLGGEAAVAFVVPSGEASFDSNELRRQCRQVLPAFKVPHRVFVVEELPRTPSGKVAKAALREIVDHDNEVLEGRVEAGSGGEGV